MAPEAHARLKRASFTDLSSCEFEEFCYELLQRLGATELNWRKGTDLASSPADQGRDIECEIPRKEIDGSTSFERWFVECKNYKTGVPPDKIQGLFSWANAKRPHVALIIAAGFLSNPCKDFLETYERENHPFYRIKIWEKKDLEQLTAGMPALLRKFNLGDEFPHLALMHPVHLYYLREPPLNTLDYFFEVLDSLEAQEKGNFLGTSMMSIINPRLKKPTDPTRQTLRELLDPPISYSLFREKCFVLAKQIEPFFLIRSITLQSLGDVFRRGDKTATEMIRQNLESSLSGMRAELDSVGADKLTIDACIRDLENSLGDIESNFEKGYRDYCSFCDKVVSPLLLERFEIPPPSDWFAEQ